MKIAKLIRHRHRFEHYLNEVIRGVEEEVHYKVVFSDIEEKKLWEQWLKDRGGSYKWDSDENKVTADSILPEIEGYNKEELCWCTTISHYLLNVANYELKIISSPYKMEVYVRN